MIFSRMLATGGLRYNAATFNGSNTKLLRGADLTGAADGKQLTASVWVYLNSNTTRTIFSNMTTGATDPGVSLLPGDDSLNGSMAFLSRTSADGDVVRLRADTSVMATGTWYHILLSFDATSSSKKHVYISDVSQTITSAYYSNASFDLTTGNFGIGVLPVGAGANYYSGRMLDLWVDDTYIDLSVTSARRKFVSGAIKPPNLGDSGQNPTGSPPLVYFRDYDDFSTGNNRGTGGNFTVSGTMTEISGPW